MEIKEGDERRERIQSGGDKRRERRNRRERKEMREVFNRVEWRVMGEKEKIEKKRQEERGRDRREGRDSRM